MQIAMAVPMECWRSRSWRGSIPVSRLDRSTKLPVEGSTTIFSSQRVEGSAIAPEPYLPKSMFEVSEGGSLLREQ
jgi:hypothetical protein